MSSVLVECVAAAIAAAWQRRRPRLLAVHAPVILGRYVSMTSIRHLPAALENELDRLETQCRRVGRPGAASLRCWPAPQGRILLELSSDLAPCRQWRIPVAALAGAPPRRRRGRRALPARPQTRSLPPSICMRSDNPAHIEWVHAAAAHLQIGAVRALPTLRSARSWLATHPGCRVLMLDRPEGVWLLDLSAAYAPFLLAVANVPGLTGALRKIFHHVPEISVRGGKIAA